MTCLEKMYDYNQTRPSQMEKRAELIKEMFAEAGEGCYIEPPFYANWGGRHVHLGNPCRVLRELNDHDREYYYRDRKIDWVGYIEIKNKNHRTAVRKLFCGSFFNLLFLFTKLFCNLFDQLLLIGVQILKVFD